MADKQFANLASLNYKFHDTVVEQFQFDAVRGRLLLTIRGRDSDSNDIVWMQLIISGIINSKELSQYQEKINCILAKEKRALLNYRIERLDFYEEKNIELFQLNIQLFIDHLEPLLIKCVKATDRILNF